MSTVSQDIKLNLLHQVLGDDKSDESTQTRIYCLAALPDAGSKQEAWNKIVQKNSQMSAKEVEQVIQAFPQSDLPELTAKYSAAFFLNLHDMYKANSYKLFKSYFHSLMPRRGEISEEMINKLRTILASRDQSGGHEKKQVPAS